MEKLPRTSKDLYVEMYCRRKADSLKDYEGIELEIATQDLKIEAVKSWILLSRDQKKYFHEKLNECHRNYKKMFADYLESSAELYMKHQRGQESSSADITEPLEQETQSHSEDDQNSLLEVQREGPIEIEAQHEDVVNTHEETLHRNTMPPMSVLEPEPSPPTALNARRLFELTCKTDSNWTALTKHEKRQYQNAVVKLKRQYIKKYRSFLEQLSDRDLYEHYVSALY